MQSNTKLTPEQKIFRRNMLLDMPSGSQIVVSDNGITILTVPAGNTNMVFSSIMSADESKFRRKVGEFMVLHKYWDMLDWAAKPQFVVPNYFTAVDILGSMYGQDALSITDF